MGQAKLILEEIGDSAEIARSVARFEQGRRNSKWLESHWHEVLPGARGRYVAVAGRQAFVGDTPEEAWASAKQAHPDDSGAFVQYVVATAGPRVYAHRS
jgi:hypothetical protein